MHELLNYLLIPDYYSSKQPRIKHFLILLGFYILAGITFGFFSSGIIKYYHLKNIVFATLHGNMILYAIILAPLCEESLFRSLLKFKKINIILFISALTLYGGIAIFHSNYFHLSIISILLISFITLLIIIPRSKIEAFIVTNFKYFFWATAIVFGLVHLSNFIGNIYILMAFSLILTAPQIVAGFILGYIRMNYGLVYSMLFHVAINSTILLIVFKHT